MRKTWALYKKELRSYFVSPLFYVVAAVFLCLCGVFFRSDLDFYVQFGFGMNILGNFFQLFFADMAKVMLITVPLLTMRLFAEERKLGTIELLFTYPLRETEIFAGKFLAAFTVFGVMLSATLLYPIFLYQIQPFPIALVIAPYGALFLLGLVFIACGCFVSSITDSQVVAGVGSVGLLFLIWIMSWNEASGTDQVMAIIKGYSTAEHFANLAKGVVDLQDVAYYLFTAAFFSALTLRSLESRRWRGKR